MDEKQGICAKKIYSFDIIVYKGFIMSIKDELDLLKKQILSENQRKLEPEAAVQAEPSAGARKMPDDSGAKKRKRTLNRPSRREAHIVYYGLNGMSNVRKVQFSYALTGRTNQIGILQKMKGKKLGRGCLLVPAVNLGDMQEFFKYWNVDVATQKILLLD